MFCFLYCNGPNVCLRLKLYMTRCIFVCVHARTYVCMRAYKYAPLVTFRAYAHSRRNLYITDAWSLVGMSGLMSVTEYTALG